jgi:acyl carrier protein
LQTILPDYMVPAAFVWLAALPLTPNGKIDRRALPAPAGGAPAGDGYAPPGTALEGELAGIWAATLGLERVGLHDHFFADLGGHSLLATQLLSRLRTTLGIDLPLSSIFTAPTVGQFAQLVEAYWAAPASPAAPEPAASGAAHPDDLAGLSEAEVDALLEQLLAEEATR